MKTVIETRRGHNCKKAYQAGLGRKSRAVRLGYALRGAPRRKRDEYLSALAAVVAGSKIREDLDETMRLQGLDPADALVYLVYRRGPGPFAFGYVQMHSSIADQNDEKAFQSATVIRSKAAEPVGFAIIIIDRELGDAVGSVRPLIVSEPRVTESLELATGEIAEALGLRLI